MQETQWMYGIVAMMLAYGVCAFIGSIVRSKRIN